MIGILAELYRDEEGQGMSEYAIILVVIAIASTAAMVFLADKLKTVFEKIVDTLTD